MSDEHKKTRSRRALEAAVMKMTPDQLVRLSDGVRAIVDPKLRVREIKSSRARQGSQGRKPVK